jgi:hypothetical protein
VRAWRSKDAPLLPGLVGYLIILGTSLAAFAGVSAWIVPVAALGLATVSAWEHRHLYRRAREIGASAIADETLLGSVWNGLLASGAVYGFGYVLRLL